MKLAWITLIIALAIASPQFWLRIDAPSNLQPIFLLVFIFFTLFKGRVSIPSRLAPRLVLLGFSTLFMAGLLSLPFVSEFELFKQEFYRRIILFLFFIATYTAASTGDKLFRSVTCVAVAASITYLTTMVLYYIGWNVLSESGAFDSYPFRLILPIAVYNNPLIFSETQVLGYFIIGVAMLHLAKASRTFWSLLLVGMLQFGKGPIIGYVTSLLPRFSRTLMILVLPLVIFIAAASYSGAPRFDGDFGSLSERVFHADFVLHSLLEHPLLGALGYGFRQYGTYVQFISGDFNQDTQPLSVMQWFFEAGVPLALFGLITLFAGTVVLSGKRWLPVGIYLFIGHLALPNPVDPAVLILFAIFSAQINRSPKNSNEQRNIS